MEVRDFLFYTNDEYFFFIELPIVNKSLNEMVEEAREIAFDIFGEKVWYVGAYTHDEANKYDYEIF